MDDQCTIKPYGLTDTLYVYFRKDFEFNDERLWGSYANPNTMLFVFTPTDQSPTETYQIRAFRNFLSEEFTEPFKKGSVYQITNVLGPIDVSEIKTAYLL